MVRALTLARNDARWKDDETDVDVVCLGQNTNPTKRKEEEKEGRLMARAKVEPGRVPKRTSLG